MNHTTLSYNDQQYLIKKKRRFWKKKENCLVFWYLTVKTKT